MMARMRTTIAAAAAAIALTLAVSSVSAQPSVSDCTPAEIADCNGHCIPSVIQFAWNGDDICQDGTSPNYEVFGQSVNFNCAAFGYGAASLKMLTITVMTINHDHCCKLVASGLTEATAPTWSRRPRSHHALQGRSSIAWTAAPRRP